MIGTDVVGTRRIVKECSNVDFAINQLISDEEDKKLFKMYIENKYKNREYHNINHIEDVFTFSSFIIQDMEKMGLDVSGYKFNTANKSKEFKTFLIAILFHDTIQTHSDSSSIALSKTSAIHICEWFNIEYDVDLLNRLIDITNHPCTYKHEEVNNKSYLYSDLTDIIHDADLYILSTVSFTYYMKYVEKIYKEFITSSPSFRADGMCLFVEKRSEFLNNLLKENIYSLAVNKLNHNTQGREIVARRNIERELDMYKNQIYIF